MFENKKLSRAFNNLEEEAISFGQYSDDYKRLVEGFKNNVNCLAAKAIEANEFAEAAKDRKIIFLIDDSGSAASGQGETPFTLAKRVVNDTRNKLGEGRDNVSAYAYCDRSIQPIEVSSIQSLEARSSGGIAFDKVLPNIPQEKKQRNDYISVSPATHVVILSDGDAWRPNDEAQAFKNFYTTHPNTTLDVVILNKKDRAYELNTVVKEAKGSDVKTTPTLIHEETSEAASQALHKTLMERFAQTPLEANPVYSNKNAAKAFKI